MDEDLILENPNSWDQIFGWLIQWGVMQCLSSPLERQLFSIRSVHCTVACDNTVDGQIPALQFVWYWYGEYIYIRIYIYIHIIHNISLQFFNPFQLVQDVVYEEEQYHQLQWPLTGRSGPTTPDRGCGPQNGSWLAGKEERSDTPITTG